MKVCYAKNKNKLVIPEIDECGCHSTKVTEANYLDIFYGDFFKKNGEFTKKRKQHFCACNEIKKIITNKIGNKFSYSELFGGIGLKAALFCDDMLSSEIQINELNPDCIDVLQNNFKNAKISCGNAFYYEFDRNYDVSVIDFNNYALSKYNKGWKSVVDNVFAHTDKFVVLNDCSIYYFNRTFDLACDTYTKILGTKINSILYYRTVIKHYYEKHYPGWQLTHIFTCPQTDFILFEKTDEYRSLDINNYALVDENLEDTIIYTEDESLFGGE